VAAVVFVLFVAVTLGFGLSRWTPFWGSGANAASYEPFGVAGEVRGMAPRRRAAHPGARPVSTTTVSRSSSL